ncbi:MAG: hypothetical protein P4K93_01240 [Terracidiphilus sp.]|nr:hypothetical protein [Terracidiphilus sp.]MDR3796743.1 hypothetical protein [Terracidiphilus sp.]
MAQATASTTNDELRSIVVELARTELAAVGSALKFWGDWVSSADKYTQQLRAELDKADQGGETSKQFVGKLADLTREYLREVVALPAAAVEHFNNEVEKNASAARAASPTPAAAPAKRKRRARAKE